MREPRGREEPSRVKISYFTVYDPVLPLMDFDAELPGIAHIIKIVKKVLEKYRSQTIYLIIGLMIGSIYAIIMGATTLKIPQEPLSFRTFNILYFAVSGIIILGMELAKRKLENKV